RNPVAQAYAGALLAVAMEKGEADLYRDQLVAISTTVEGDAQIQVFLESPKIRRSDKKAALEKALSGQVSVAVLNLIQILIDRGRQGLIEDIAHAYQDRMDVLAGRVNATITSATKLSSAIRKALVGAIAKKLDKEVVSTEQVDPDLLAGLTIQVGDLVVDGSLRTQLRKVRQEVSQTRFGKDLIDEN
ncbi:MAG: ATP synthase F1 subunit delta, partial [Planctomycetes bacterium]|nr:ATP synthase F1 subunit delta [Planctomycetota bacterium]